MSQTDATKTQDYHRRKERAEKILDTAGDLLVRFGYKRVTIDDVARYAGVGKGTIYLHWKTREDLFEAVIWREMSGILDELLEALRKDHKELLLHRALRAEFLAVMRRPIMRAIFTADFEMLGKMGEGGVSRALDVQTDLMFVQYLRILREHGLVRTDMTPEEIFYAVGATSIGFYMIDPFSTEEFPFDIEQKADLLERTTKRAFEIENDPGQTELAEIAQQVTEMLSGISEQYHSELSKAYD